MSRFKSKEAILSNLITIQTGFQVRGFAQKIKAHLPFAFTDKTLNDPAEPPQKLKTKFHKLSEVSVPYSNFSSEETNKALHLINPKEKYKSYNLIQAKSACRDILYHIKPDGLEQMFIPERKSKFISKYLVQKNDVLYLSKLTPGAFRYTGPINNTLPMAHFYILRPKVNYIDSDYLCWALNQSFTIRGYVQKHLTGSALPFISRIDLMNFKIPLPSMSIQKKIVCLLKLRAREKLLQETVDEKKHILINSVLKKLL